MFHCDDSSAFSLRGWWQNRTLLGPTDKHTRVWTDTRTHKRACTCMHAHTDQGSSAFQRSLSSGSHGRNPAEKGAATAELFRSSLTQLWYLSSTQTTGSHHQLSTELTVKEKTACWQRRDGIRAPWSPWQPPRSQKLGSQIAQIYPHQTHLVSQQIFIDHPLRAGREEASRVTTSN